MKNRLILKIIMVPLLAVCTFGSAHAHDGEKEFSLFTSLFHGILHTVSNDWFVYSVALILLLGVISWTVARSRIAT